ncbi:HmuY family protein [Chitinophagaceae bacterium MMS25-I14]
MKIRRSIRTLPILVLLFLFASCLKKESPVTLPPGGTSEHIQVEMGEDYKNQLFFDLESGQVVYTSKVESWDLAFEASAAGYHVFMNGGKNILIANTYDTSFQHVNTYSCNSILSSQNDGAWKFDWPSGTPDSTGLGEWKDAKGASYNYVYVVSVDSTYKKIRLILSDDSHYLMEYGELDDQAPQRINIPKNSNYNFAYFSFSDANKIVTPEPPKNTWDFVFTRYRYIYKNLGNFRYQVTGALLNPYKTTGIADSTTGYEKILATSIGSYTFYPWRDIIGFDWKSYDYTNSNARYIVNPKKCYILHNRNDEYWKLHFLDYYTPDGKKGSPLFEYERLQ